jgi:hypothetical protein
MNNSNEVPKKDSRCLPQSDLNYVQWIGNCLSNGCVTADFINSFISSHAGQQLYMLRGVLYSLHRTLTLLHEGRISEGSSLPLPGVYLAATKEKDYRIVLIAQDHPPTFTCLSKLIQPSSNSKKTKFGTLGGWSVYGYVDEIGYLETIRTNGKTIPTARQSI